MRGLSWEYLTLILNGGIFRAGWIQAYFCYSGIRHPIAKFTWLVHDQATMSCPAIFGSWDPFIERGSTFLFYLTIVIVPSAQRYKSGEYSWPPLFPSISPLCYPTSPVSFPVILTVLFLLWTLIFIVITLIVMNDFCTIFMVQCPVLTSRL